MSLIRLNTQLRRQRRRLFAALAVLAVVGAVAVHHMPMPMHGDGTDTCMAVLILVVGVAAVAVALTRQTLPRPEAALGWPSVTTTPPRAALARAGPGSSVVLRL